MQITLVSIAAVLGMLSNAATASPIKRQEDAPFTITEPAESTVVGSGQNLAICKYMDLFSTTQ